MQNKTENTERPSADTSSSPSNAGNLDTVPGATTSCAAAPCSASVPYKYAPQKVSLVIGNELITITVDQTQQYKDDLIRQREYWKPILSAEIEALEQMKNERLSRS